MVNHFEFHAEITTKDNLFKNMLSYAEYNKLNVFDYVPLTFVLDIDSPTYGSDFEKFILCYNTINSGSGSVFDNTVDKNESCLNAINKKLNQVTFSKDRRVVSHSRAKLSPMHFVGKNLWILKPTEFNRGRGVTVFDTIEKLKALIKIYSQESALDFTGDNKNAQKKKADNQNFLEAEQTLNNAIGEMIKSRVFVIQKYIERPLLIHNRKFDIRVWVLVAQDMKVYFFKEGYLRTSSEAFTMDSSAIDKKNVHLTNNAVQKYCENYGQFEDGNQVSFSQFEVYLKGKFPEKNINVQQDLVSQMKKITVMTMQSVRRKLNAADRQYCFEIFGYDFIIDEELKVWLIEVNTNPCLEESSKLLQVLLPRMLGIANNYYKHR